ncbi:MAG: hypothetical protein KDD59_07565 [Bdellovibrionales bacterium]|nr:hypothetical protein [Bdellovibrionales bacterium]
MKAINILIGLSLIFSMGGVLGCRKSSDTSNLKTMRLALGDDTKTLDPATAYDSVSLDVVPLIYEGLYQYNYDKRPVEPEPLLAEGMPQISDDKLTYTIKIKKGVLFHDSEVFASGKGRELKAEDVVYGWKRLAIPQLKSPGIWVYDGKIKGYSDFKKMLQNNRENINDAIHSPIVGLNAVDDYTIKVQLTEPYPQLIHIMTMPFAAPVPKEAAEKWGQEGLIRKMVGTGPFYLKTMTEGSKIILAKNPHYHVKDLPKLDEISYQIIKEPLPAWLMFLKGQLDLSGIPKDSYDTAIQDDKHVSEELKNKGISLLIQERPVSWYLNFNIKDSLLGKNADLRRAIVRTIDRDQFIEKFLNGRGVKATSLIPTAIPGHVTRDHVPGDYNLAEAKKYLEKAGYPNGKGLPEIRYDLRGASTPSRQQAEYFKNSLAQVGINIKIIPNSFPAYLEKEKNGNLQFFMGGWGADYPDAENFLQLFYSKNVSPGPNASNYVNPEFDKLYERIAKMEDSEDRRALIKKAEDLLFDEAICSMLFFPTAYILQHQWVSNYKPNELISNIMKYVDVDPKSRDTALKKHF